MQKIPFHFWPALSGTSKSFIQHLGYIKHEQHKKTHALFRNRLAKHSQSNSSKLLENVQLSLRLGQSTGFKKLSTSFTWPGNNMYFLQNSFRKSCPPLTGMSLCTTNMDLHCKCHTTSLWIISYTKFFFVLCNECTIAISAVYWPYFFIDHNNPS